MRRRALEVSVDASARSLQQAYGADAMAGMLNAARNSGVGADPRRDSIIGGDYNQGCNLQLRGLRYGAVMCPANRNAFLHRAGAKGR